MDAFDADVLIYAAAPGHPLGRRVLPLLERPAEGEAHLPVGMGSVLLLGELLTKPTRNGDRAELRRLAALLGRLELVPIDLPTAALGVALGASYGLPAMDGLHLAAAVSAGADRFVTNNGRDLSTDITEIEIVHPTDLAEPDL